MSIYRTLERVQLERPGTPFPEVLRRLRNALRDRAHLRQ